MDSRVGLEVALFGAAPYLAYRAGGGWSMVWPCVTCGGAVLPLAASFSVGDLDGDLSDAGEQLAAEVCPGCHTVAMRSNPAGADPSVWYDTLLHDWVVRLPSHGDANGPVMPLGLCWFDAPRSLVIRSAADIVYAGDALLEDLAQD